MTDSIDLLCDSKFHDTPLDVGTFLRDVEKPTERIRVTFQGKRKPDGSFKNPQSVHIVLYQKDGVDCFGFTCRCGVTPAWRHDTVFPIIDQLMNAGVTPMTIAAIENQIDRIAVRSRK
jgi:hypothetical protein